MTDPLFTVEGRAILVAGGAGGLGRPLAESLARRGARVLVADIDETAARATAEVLEPHGLELDRVLAPVRGLRGERVAGGASEEGVQHLAVDLHRPERRLVRLRAGRERVPVEARVGGSEHEETVRLG